AFVRRADVSFFFSSRSRHTSFSRDWSSDVCSSDLGGLRTASAAAVARALAGDRRFTATEELGRTVWRLDATATGPPRDRSAASPDRKSGVEGQRGGPGWRRPRPKERPLPPRADGTD